VELTPSDFEYVRTLVHQRAAIVLEHDKAYLVEARLLNVARTAGFPSVANLIAQLRASKFNDLHRQVVEAMTINETSFFRDIQPFEALRKSILPDILARRKTEHSLRIWCAACSTGQEAYTIAMLLREHFPQLKSWCIEILATDLSTQALERARRGTYSQLEVNRGLPVAYLLKYFHKRGVNWQINDDIRKMIQFRPLNLIEPWPAVSAMDIIFIRNVLIYFDVDTKKQILAKVRSVLRPDGYVFLGGGETTFNLDDAFERVDIERAGCYRLRRRL
jgi:chemotaxis protein methyltransferase CheR